MNCFSCSKNIKKEIKCSQCNNIFCCDSCIAFHYIFYHQNEINVQDINNEISNNNLNINENKKSPFITEGYFLKEIKYESIYDIKNFKHQLVNGKPKLLGYGSFGNVFLEINKINKKFYAIKHIEKKRIYKALHTLDNIYNEIKIQSKICHPNIVKILYANESEKYFDIVLEYANKGNLFYYIQENENLSESKSFKIFIQIVNAVYFLHKNNFIHRDIKPENILLFDKNVAKLCDFGWCVEFNDEPRNTFCGTTEYMAPEMLNEKNYGKEIDIWSLGILLYEMLHGHSPFKPNKPNFNDKDVIKNIIYQNNIKYKNNLSKECIELMNHLIDKNIKRRYSLDDIINSQFVKKFEKLVNIYKQKNIKEFQKINPRNPFESSNSSRNYNYNKNIEQKLTNNQISNINRRNSSRDNTRKILNSFLSMENDNSNNDIIIRKNSCINFTKNSQLKRNVNNAEEENKFYFRTISQNNIKKLNPKFSSPKVEKINNNRIQKEEDFENNNLSNIFNDDSVFNNNKEERKSKINNQNPPTININILLNEINFSNGNNNTNYEKKILKKIFGSDKDNNFKKILNSSKNSKANSNNRNNNYIKNNISIFTYKNNNINNFKDLKSCNNSKNNPIFIKQKSHNIANNSDINQIKINKLFNYFGSNEENNIEKIKDKNNSSLYTKESNINIAKDQINKNSINNKEKECSNKIISKSEMQSNNSNFNQKDKNKLKDKLISETKNYDLTNLHDFSKGKILPSNNSTNLDLIKTPKKSEDKFLLPTKYIFSNLSEELRVFNNKKQS